MALTESERAKRFKLFKNGDERYFGRDFVLNRRRIRTWDSFLQAVTNDTKSREAVRSIRTPTGGTRISSLDELQDHNNYVAVGNGRFKRIGYLQLTESVPKKIGSPRNSDDVRPVEHSRIQVSGRIRKIPTDVITIFVYANGKLLEPARRVTLTHAMLRNWEAILYQITEKVNLTSGACRRLYSIDGALVTGPGDLQTAGYYVAVGADVGGFKKMDYGHHKPAFNNSPKRERRKLDPIVYPSHRKQRGSHRGTQNGSLDNSLTSTGGSSGDKSSPAGSSGQRGQRPIRHHPAAKKREDEGPFHAKPVKHKRSSEKERPKQVDYDKDEGGVFKAKNKNKETDEARTIEDSNDTQVDLPIDQVEAEEVKDEEIEGEDETPRHDNHKATRHAKVKAEATKRRTPTPSPTPRKSASPRRTPTPSPRSAASSRRSREGASPPPRTPSPRGDSRAQEEEAQDPDQEAAAARIQASYRGYQSRKGTSERNATQDVPQSPKPESPAPESDTPLDQTETPGGEDQEAPAEQTEEAPAREAQSPSEPAEDTKDNTESADQNDDAK